MTTGVPQDNQPPSSGSLASCRPSRRARRNSFRASLLLLGALSALSSASAATAAPATVGMGSAGSFSVLAGSTVTNTGPTTMFGDLGLSPGSSVTGAPHVLGAIHVDDAVSVGAKNDLTTAYNDAASRPSNGSAGTDLAGQVFTPGVRTASSSLLLSSGTVTLNAEGDPNAVFIFKIGSTLITGSNTSVSLINGAQACNVFWQIGSSATLGTGTRFVGTIMALATITAKTAATIHGRLLASTGAVNLDTNTITTSTCAAGGGETTTPSETVTLKEATKVAQSVGATGIRPTSTPAQRAAARRRAIARRHASERRIRARHPLPNHRTPFTG
jgi:Ice-binding-like